MRSLAFTLIELLVVISIISVLAALLLPTLAVVQRKAKVKAAKSEIQNIITAITQYKSSYSRLPASKKAVDAASAPGFSGDFTYGTLTPPPGSQSLVGGTYEVKNGGNWENGNSEVLGIVTANNFTNTIVKDMNMNGYDVFNPRKEAFFHAKPLQQV